MNIPSDLQRKAKVWCFRNKIFVKPTPNKFGVTIIVDNRGKIIKSGKNYSQKELQYKIFEIYEHYYNTLYLGR